MPDARIDGLIDRTDLAVLPYIHIADLCLCADARRTGIWRSCSSRSFSPVVSSLAQMKISTEQMTLSGAGERYDLRADHRDTEDQAGGRGGAPSRDGGNLYAQSAKMTYDPPMFLKLNSVISLAISLTGNARHVLYVSKSRPVCGGLLCLHGLRHGLPARFCRSPGSR